MGSREQEQGRTARTGTLLVSVDIQKALKLALNYNIYAYDAYFLQCANHLSIPLITLDKRMKKVAYVEQGCRTGTLLT
ncbi:MAG: type II toxin-antitoxin system VapC family toxin [Gammaproteobacteria bacterium]